MYSYLSVHRSIVLCTAHRLRYSSTETITSHFSRPFARSFLWAAELSNGTHCPRRLWKCTHCSVLLLVCSTTTMWIVIHWSLWTRFTGNKSNFIYTLSNERRKSSAASASEELPSRIRRCTNCTCFSTGSFYVSISEVKKLSSAEQ